MGKGKKLIVLLLVAVLLIGGYFAARHFLKEDGAEEETDTSAVPIAAMQKDDIDGVLYVCGDDTIELEKTGDKWILKADPAFPVKQAYAETMAGDAANLEAVRLISESADDFAQYGLDEPETAYVFNLKDGSQVTYYIGNYNSFGSTYYMNVAGTEKIYLISADFIDDFGHDLSELADVLEMKTVPTEDIRDLTLTLDGESTRLFCAEDGLKTVYSDLFTWFMDDKTPAEAAAAQDLAGKAASFSAVGCGDYKAENAELASYGLDAPVLTAKFTYTVSEEKDTGKKDENGEAVTEKTEHSETMTLLVGSASKNGSLYAKTDASDVVYLIDAEYLKTLRDFDKQTLRSKRVCAVMSTEVLSMDVTADGKTSTITVTRTESANDAGKTVYKIGDQEIDSTKYEAFYAAVQSLNAEAFADKTVSMENAPITVTFHTTRKGFETMTLRLTPYDQNFYAAEMNGAYGALVNKRDAEKIIKTFQAIGE